MNHITTIKEIIHKYDCAYVPIYNDLSLNNIYELLVNNIAFEPIHIVDHVYLGVYYQFIQPNVILMKKHYKFAINKGDIYALYNYCIHVKTNNNNNKIKKYFTIGMNKNITIFSWQLGIYHQTMSQIINKEESNILLMEKYYDMALNININNIMDILHEQYKYTDEDYDYTKIVMEKIIVSIENVVCKFLEIVYKYANLPHQVLNHELIINNLEKQIGKNNCNAMLTLGYYYFNNKKDPKMAKYYFLESVTHGNINANLALGKYYKNKQKYDLMKRYYSVLVSNNNDNNDNIVARKDMIYHYLYVEKNYKMAKMYGYINCLTTTHTQFCVIDDYYGNSGLPLSLLEYYVNFTNRINRIWIIDMFNRCTKCNFINQEKIIFKQIIDNFEFTSEDNFTLS